MELTTIFAIFSAKQHDSKIPKFSQRFIAPTVGKSSKINELSHVTLIIKNKNLHTVLSFFKVCKNDQIYFILLKW